MWQQTVDPEFEINRFSKFKLWNIANLQKLSTKFHVKTELFISTVISKNCFSTFLIIWFLGTLICSYVSYLLLFIQLLVVFLLKRTWVWNNKKYRGFARKNVCSIELMFIISLSLHYLLNKTMIFFAYCAAVHWLKSKFSLAFCFHQAIVVFQITIPIFYRSFKK